MSQQATRYAPTRSELYDRAVRKSDRRISALTDRPVRAIRERREAFERMCGMIEHVREYAVRTGKPGLIVGTGFYVAHNGQHFIARKGVEKVFEKSVTMVAMFFDPLQFMSGHLD